MARAGGALFPVAYGVQSVGRDAETDEVPPDTEGAAFTEGEVVLVRSPLVAVTLYEKLFLAVFVEPAGDPLENALKLRLDIRSVEVEIDTSEDVHVRRTGINEFESRCIATVRGDMFWLLLLF